MRKIVFVLMALICMATDPTIAAELPRDSAGQKYQFYAPNGTKTVLLTVNSTVVDLTNDTRWEAYTPTACKYRMMPTATKAGSELTLAAGAITNRGVNSATKFLNLTGCASGELTRQ